MRVVPHHVVKVCCILGKNNHLIIWDTSYYVIGPSAAVKARLSAQPFRTPWATRHPSTCLVDTHAQAKLGRASCMAGRRADVTMSAATYSARASAAVKARLSAQPFRTPWATRHPSSCLVDTHAQAKLGRASAPADGRASARANDGTTAAASACGARAVPPSRKIRRNKTQNC